MPTLQFKGRNIIWNHHLSVPYHTLDEVTELNFQEEISNGNLIIEGDNLVALKSLLPMYSNAIKCIYIDPPYNTGNDNGQGKGWIYNDNVNSPLIKEWLKKEVGEQDLTRHDKWLCMMTPRLKLLKELLCDGGVIFISINEIELHHLRCIMDEIFGEDNFIEIFSWTKTSTPPGLSSKSRKTNEYILCYENDKKSTKYTGELLDNGDQPLLNTGNAVQVLTFPKDKVFLKIPDGIYEPGEIDRVRLLKKITVKDGLSDIDITLEGEFKWTEGFLGKELKKGTTFIIKSERFAIRFIRVNEGGYKAPTNLIKEKLLTSLINKDNFNVGTNETASTELESLLGPNAFPYPKPVSLISFLLNLCTKPGDIILDSFAGSGTTLHAVMELDKVEGNRKCILVQMKEDSLEEPDKNICKEKTRERVKAAIEQLDYKSGFKYLRVGIPIDPESLLSGILPKYSQFAEYVYYLATGDHLVNKIDINSSKHYVGTLNHQAIYLIYEADMNKLSRIALNLEIAKAIIAHSPGKRRVIYAPACFLDEDYMSQHQIEFVSIPYNLFERKLNS